MKKKNCSTRAGQLQKFFKKKRDLGGGGETCRLTFAGEARFEEKIVRGSERLLDLSINE
jgi:hypothetical protein